MDNYIGLGDSISISSYPSLDAGLGIGALVGAADLTGLELLRLKYVHKMYNLTRDGAVIEDVLSQIEMLPTNVCNGCNIITLTIHGNDISFAGMSIKPQERKYKYKDALERIKRDYVNLITHVLGQFPNSLLLINTSYDPTDGTGELPGCGQWTKIAADWYSPMRRDMGEFIRDTYEGGAVERVLVCDLFKLFDGHGMREGNPSARWYYKGFMIEPGCNGAKYISELWLETIADWVVKQQKSEKVLSFSH